SYNHTRIPQSVLPIRTQYELQGPIGFQHAETVGERQPKPQRWSTAEAAAATSS
ncbi:hypothetical protein pipiens_000394, partial [Culex pipiens pipiens]